MRLIQHLIPFWWWWWCDVTFFKIHARLQFCTIIASPILLSFFIFTFISLQLIFWMVLRPKAPSTWPCGPCTYTATHPSPLSMPNNITFPPHNSPGHLAVKVGQHRCSWEALIWYVFITLILVWVYGALIVQSNTWQWPENRCHLRDLVRIHCTFQDKIQNMSDGRQNCYTFTVWFCLYFKKALKFFL